MENRFRKSSLIGLILLVAAVAAWRCVFITPVVMAQAPEVAADDEEESELVVAMKKMNKTLRLVKRSVRKADQQVTTLEQIQVMQQCALIAKDKVPPMTVTIDQPARAKFIREYRLSMIKLMGKLLALEQVVIEGDTVKAGTLVKELLDMRFKGHQNFTEE